jgi:hypothetical protein
MPATAQGRGVIEATAVGVRVGVIVRVSVGVREGRGVGVRDGFGVFVAVRVGVFGRGGVDEATAVGCRGNRGVVPAALSRRTFKLAPGVTAWRQTETSPWPSCHER